MKSSWEGPDRIVPLARDDGEGFLGSSLKPFPSRADVLQSFFSAALGTPASILNNSERDGAKIHQDVLIWQSKRMKIKIKYGKLIKKRQNIKNTIKINIYICK